MRYFNSFLLLITVIFSFVGCSTNSDSSAQLNLEGTFGAPSLSGQEIFEIKTHGEHLYAGTGNNLYSKTKQETAWQPLGLPDGEVRTFVVLSRQEILASVNFRDRDSLTIAKTINAGQNWIPFRNGFGRDQNIIPYTMDADNENPSIIFARPAALTLVAKSTNLGKSWESVVQSWENPNFGTSSFVKVDPHHPKNIWAGGATAYFQPTLLRSKDNGKTWKGFLVIKNVETTVYDLVSEASDAEHVLAGMSGVVQPAKLIRKSTDGGETWMTVFNKAGIYTMAHSASNPEVVYASGQSGTGTLFFVASGDFGDTWQTVQMANSPGGIHVNDMVSVMEGGHEVLYFGTNKGVYSYTFEK